MLRRTFLQWLSSSPLGLLVGKTETPAAVIGNKTGAPLTWQNTGHKVVRIWWDGRWWRSFGSRISWTERRGIWLELPNRTEFTEFNVLPTLDWCADMCIWKDSLVWMGRYGAMWRIERVNDALLYRFTKIDLRDIG